MQEIFKAIGIVFSIFLVLVMTVVACYLTYILGVAGLFILLTLGLIQYFRATKI